MSNPISKTAQEVLSPSKMAHVVLQTNNYVPMINFWTTFLGARLVHESDFVSFITYDEEHHRIAIAKLPGIKDRDKMTCGLQHVAFTYNDVNELATAYEQRKKLNMLPFWCINHGTTISMYYQDPDGNEVESQVDCFPDPLDATKYMNSKFFVENPVGVDFNPEDFVKRVRSGESPSSIMERPDIGPRELSIEKRIPPPTLA